MRECIQQGKSQMAEGKVKMIELTNGARPIAWNVRMGDGQFEVFQMGHILAQAINGEYVVWMLERRKAEAEAGLGFSCVGGSYFDNVEDPRVEYIERRKRLDDELTIGERV